MYPAYQSQASFISKGIERIKSFSINKDLRLNNETIEVLYTSRRIIEQLIQNMVYVDGGTFLMGSVDYNESMKKKYIDYKHDVTLSSFCISKYLFTYREYWALWFLRDYIRAIDVLCKKTNEYNETDFIWKNSNVMANVHTTLLCTKHPFVGYKDDIDGSLWTLRQITGLDFSCPTESEWEFAARGGNLSKGFLYSGSNNYEDVAWFKENTRKKYGMWRESKEVGLKQPNELGLYDMSGNVNEWCEDKYAPYSFSHQYNPIETNGDAILANRRIFRGGSYKNHFRECYVFSRKDDYGKISMEDVGFRLVLRQSRISFNAVVL